MNNLRLLIIPLLFLGLPLVFAEDYYYIPDHKLETPPIFCAMEFEDERLPTAQHQLMEITENAVLDWKTKLIEATDETQGWNFQFEQISLERQQELFFDSECTVNIYFERQPSKGELDYLGYAYSYLTFSDITIFYLEHTYNRVEPYEVTGFTNVLTYGLHDTIRHEIGHALGLDHPNLESYMFSKDGNVYHSPSIMIDEWDYELDGEIDYSITDYDVRSIINLYGEDGIDEINFMAYAEFLVFAIILIIIIYFVGRKFRSKDPELIPLDTSNDGSTRCMRCNKLISSQTQFCNSCKSSES